MQKKLEMLLIKNKLNAFITYIFLSTLNLYAFELTKDSFTNSNVIEFQENGEEFYAVLAQDSFERKTSPSFKREKLTLIAKGNLAKFLNLTNNYPSYIFKEFKSVFYDENYLISIIKKKNVIKVKETIEETKFNEAVRNYILKENFDFDKTFIFNLNQNSYLVSLSIVDFKITKTDKVEAIKLAKLNSLKQINAFLNGENIDLNESLKIENSLKEHLSKTYLTTNGVLKDYKSYEFLHNFKFYSITYIKII